MNIKELEFIRDFCDKLSLVQNDLSSLALALSEEGYEDGTTFEKILMNNIWSINHQTEAIEEILSNFKDQVDSKYCSEWKKVYPQMSNNKEEQDKNIHNLKL